MSTKTIAIFSEYYPPHLGGLENYVYNIGNILHKRGYNIIVITTKYDENQNIEEIINGIRILRYPVHKLFVSRYPIPKRDTIYKNIIKKLENLKVDFVILNTRFFLSTSVGASFCKRNKIPNFLIEHGCEHLTVDNKILDYFGSLYEHVLTKSVAGKIDEFYGVSQACNDWLNHFHLKTSGTLHGAVHIEEKDQYNKILNDEKIVFTYAGRLLRQKGVLQLVETFSELSKKYKNIELHLAGKGPLKDELEKIAKENERVCLLGYLTHEELMKQLCKTDVFVYIPIWPEGLGISVIEAGLMKCAAVISNQKGIMEVVPNEEYGYVVDANHSLYNCLESCIQNSSECIKKAEALHQRVIDVFSWEHTVDSIEEIIINRLK